MSATRYRVRLTGVTKDVSVEARGARWAISVDGQEHLVEQIVVEKDELFSLIVGDHSYLVDLVLADWEAGRLVVGAIGEQIELRVRDELEAVAEQVTAVTAKTGVFELRAPMPGIVLRALAAPGARVARGQGLVVLEAMKMQNELASEMEGLLQEILVSEGQLVETGAVLARVIRAES
jgi:biotin carboxyl carrier protein